MWLEEASFSMRRFTFVKDLISFCHLLAGHIQVSSFTADPGTGKFCPVGATATVTTFKQLY